MKNIVDNNKLIAEFMGLNWEEVVEQCKFNLYEFGHRNNEIIDNPEYWTCYNSSWDLLMKVVEKIESIPDEENNGAFFFEIYKDSVSIFGNGNYINELIEVIGQGSRINNVYQAVIEFIQWYNQSNQSLS